MADLALQEQKDLPVMSRYRNTRLYEDQDLGETYFGTWRAPRIIEAKPVTVHRVKPEEINRPDLIAHRLYGNSSLFWVIALRNNLLLPLRDLAVGQALICPHLDDVTRALTAAFANNPGTA
jgi:hypothetical protein